MEDSNYNLRYARENYRADENRNAQPAFHRRRVHRRVLEVYHFRIVADMAGKSTSLGQEETREGTRVQDQSAVHAAYLIYIPGCSQLNITEKRPDEIKIRSARCIPWKDRAIRKNGYDAS